MDDTLFQAQDICFSYLGKYLALQCLEFKVARGERIALMGANGSGKSTLLQMLDGLIFPDRGSLTGLGKELKEGVFDDPEFSRFFRSTVGLVFQNPDVQLFCPTVREDIVFGPLQLGVDKNEIKRRFDALVAVLGIEGLLERSPNQLSIGEKRKVALASTLVMKPEVLLLDEPTAGLDPLTTRHIIELLGDDDMAGKTILTATHDLHVVEEIADTVYVLSPDKRIVRIGTVTEVLGDRSMLEENNLVHVHSHRHKDTSHVHPHQHLDHHH
jgi:cobalt/nickel transport system ATP-binding protein